MEYSNTDMADSEWPQELITKRDLEGLKEYLKNGGDPDYCPEMPVRVDKKTAREAHPSAHPSTYVVLDSKTTILHLLAYERSSGASLVLFEWIQLLINSGADVGRKDWEGKTPLYLANELENEEFILCIKTILPAAKIRLLGHLDQRVLQGIQL